MPIYSGTSFRFVPFALIGLVGAAIALFFILSNKRQTFPALPGGSFIGTLQGIAERPEQSITLYAERISGANSLLILLFEEGWKPLVVPLTANKLGEFEPLQFTHQGTSYWLTGRSRSGEFAGEVQVSGGNHGRWSLRPVQPAELRQSDTPGGTDIDLRNWLRTKMRFLQYRHEFDSLEEARQQLISKTDKLERFVKDEGVLRDRSRSRRDALAQEINKVAEQRKKNTQELRDAVGMVGVLTRITKRGQVAEIARRIARRENKWLNINWTSAGDESGNLEEQLAEQEQVDLTKLNSAVKRAEEVERLRKTVADETSRIQWLEAEYQERTRGPDTAPDPRGGPEPRGGPPVREETERPWWREINPF